MSDSKKRILAIGAHVGDAEITAGPAGGEVRRGRTSGDDAAPDGRRARESEDGRG